MGPGTVRGDTVANVSDAYRVPTGLPEAHTTSVTSTTSTVQEVIEAMVGAYVVATPGSNLYDHTGAERQVYQLHRGRAGAPEVRHQTMREPT